MAGIKYQVELRETNMEFLLCIHASQKERAKEIERRRWDTERRCWVYPKTARVYDAIIAEFGDDMASPSIKRPTLPSVSAQTAALQVENQNLQRPRTTHVSTLRPPEASSGCVGCSKHARATSFARPGAASGALWMPREGTRQEAVTPPPCPRHPAPCVH
jgi:hypothetical protein